MFRVGLVSVVAGVVLLSGLAVAGDNVKLVLSVGEGCLPVRFGIGCDEIRELLGEPDQVIGKHCLDYSSSLGLSLLVHESMGMVAIDCWSKDELSDEGHKCGADFVGKFAEGIGIGSRISDVEKVFGEHAVEESEGQLCYTEIKTTFTFKRGVVTHISMDTPIDACPSR